jgi:hypothetical protein
MNMSQQVELQTSKGNIRIELDEARAPESAKNFLAYVNKGHYDGTVFHRVIKGFMVQGGGFEPGMKQKSSDAPIKNEANNGVKNDKYTLAMARTSDPAFGHRPVLHQRRRQRVPELQVRKPERLGIRGVRQGGVGPGRGRRDRRREDRPQGLPRRRSLEDVVIQRAVVV